MKKFLKTLVVGLCLFTLLCCALPAAFAAVRVVFWLCGKGFAFSISCHVFTKGKFCGMRFSKSAVYTGINFILQR